MVTLEEIKKLPPNERVAALKKFEEEHKKAREHEEKKRKQEEEQIIKSTIEDLAKEEEKKEAEEKSQKEETEKEQKKKKESLEQIAEEAKPKDKREEHAQLEYVTNLSRKPTTELYGEANRLRSSFEEKGYLNQQEAQKAENLRGAFYQKEKNYDPSEKSRMMMNAAEKMLEDVKDPTKKRYHGW